MGNYEQEKYKKKVGINDDDEDSSVFDDGDHSRSRRVSFGKNESLLFRSDTNVESLRSEAASVAENNPHGGANDVNHGHVGSGDGSDQDEVSSQAASFCDSVISDAMKKVGLTEPGSADGEKGSTKRGPKLEDHQVGSVESSVDLEYSRKNSTTSSQTGSRIQSARHRNNGNETDSPSSGIYRLEHENSVISPTDHKDGDKNSDKNGDKKGDKNVDKKGDKSGQNEVGDVKKAALRKVNEKHGVHEKGSTGALGGAMDGPTSRNDEDENSSESGDSEHEEGASSGQSRKKSKRMKSLKHAKIEADKDLVVQGGSCVY